MARKAKRRIGLVTEGRGEVVALPSLYPQLQEQCGAILLRPLYVAVDPLAPIALLCKRLIPKVNQAFARGAERVVVLLDSEDLNSCPGDRAIAVMNELSRTCTKIPSIVLKHTRFENWLVADRESFRLQPALFPDFGKVRYTNGNADNVDADTLIDLALGQRCTYSKSQHPSKILSRASVKEMRRQSKSFDKFVRELSS